MLVMYARIGERLPSGEWERLLIPMPGPLRIDIGRYRRWEDRQAVLFGKLLLAEGLRRMASPAQLGDLVWDASGRPFLGEDIDFNISHSGDYAVCALCREGRVGIDIEQLRPLALKDFQEQMTPRQWGMILASARPLDAFFDLWTRKEAVMKADGRGMAIPLEAIALEGGKAFCEGAVWTVRELPIAPGYRCALATDREEPEIRCEEVRPTQGVSPASLADGFSLA